MLFERMTRPARALPWIAALVLAGCGGDEKTEYVPPTTPVKVRPVERQTFTDYFSLLGTAEGAREATLVFEVDGMVEEIVADQGTAVSAGGAVARLRDDLYLASLDEAKAGRNLAKELYDRSAALKEKGGISDFELSRLEHEREMAEARYETAKARFDRAVVRAPFDGVVDVRYLDVGDYASPLAPFARFLDLRIMKVRVPVPEVYLSKVEPGAHAEVTADARPGRVFEGDVTFVSREVDKETRTVTVEVTLDNRDLALRPGMTLRVRMIKDVYADAVVVPQDAVVESEDGKSVFLAATGKAVLRPVRVGAVYAQRAVIDSGLAEGESLIVVGNRDLVDGELIEVLPGE